MIKTLDKLIIKAFTGPFFATFFIALFILVVQFFWLYIDDFVGKGIDLSTLSEFIVYLTATLVPLALPLAVLLSSIMTFGKLGETFELMAIKSAGIPLIRFMQPVFLASGFLGFTAFLFANYLIPVSELKMRTLLYDIRVAKPAFDIKEGIFYDKLDGYTIKIGKKLNDSVVSNILVYEKNSGLQDNLIVAEQGTMSFAADQNLLAFNLKNGWRYSEKGNERTKNTEFYRIGFKQYKKVFDISSFRLSKTADSSFKNHYRMLSFRQLNYIADSLERIADEKKEGQLLTIQQNLPLAIEDSIWSKQPSTKKANFTSIYSTIPDSLKGILNNTISGRISSLKSQAELLKYDSQESNKELRLYRMEQHRKFSLSFACVVFFFIGAPLGILTRKGGIGLPLVISVLFFIVFHIINTSGEKMVKEGVLNPLSGMWLSSFILIPIGTLLMIKARKDGAVFNFNKWFVFWQKLKKKNDNPK